MSDPTDETAKIQKDLLWGYYVELRTHARQAEATRATAINYALLAGSALIAVITLDRQVSRSDWPLCVALLAVGLFATLFSFSFLDRYYRNRNRANAALEVIDERFFPTEPKSTA